MNNTSQPITHFFCNLIKKITKAIGILFWTVLFIVSLFLILTCYWIVDKFGICSLEQIIFNLVTSTAEESILIQNYSFSFKQLVITPTLLSFCILIFILNFPYLSKCKICSYAPIRHVFLFCSAIKKYFAVYSVLAFIIAIVVAFNSITGLEILLNTSKEEQVVYQKYLVPPNPAKIAFKEKKNLVFIFLESFEKTFQNTAVFNKNLIPRMSMLASLNTSYSQPQLYGTEWTMGAIVGYLCAKTIRTAFYEDGSATLEDVICLPDILKQNGYSQKFVRGVEKSFANFDKFTDAHSLKGDVIAKDEISEIDPEWKKFLKPEWGISDKRTLKIAKDVVTSLAKKEKPFALYYLSSDTHFPNGYVDPDCSKQANEYQDVLKCSDMQIADFITWIQQQSFAKDTMLVIVSDHLFMNGPIFYTFLKKNQNLRENFNIFINPAKPLPQRARRISHFDFYPTILEGLGASLEKSRLYLGTSIYSNQPTLLEDLGENKFNQILLHNSHSIKRDRLGDLNSDHRNQSFLVKLASYLTKKFDLSAKY